MAITRTAWTDDDGSGTTGTIINNAEKTTLYDQIDTVVDAVKAGGIGIASQAALDFLYASSATQFARLAKGSGLQVPRLNAAADGYEFYTPATLVSLLVANSGTSTNAAAENVDTVAISGLTAKDTIRIFYNIDSITQDTAAVSAYNSTDSVTIVDLTQAVAVLAGAGVIGDVEVRQSQASATVVHARADARTLANAGRDGTAASTFTTAWTGSWTLALRHGGVTAGGTFRWSWAVYKIAGQ